MLRANLNNKNFFDFDVQYSNFMSPTILCKESVLFLTGFQFGTGSKNGRACVYIQRATKSLS